MDNIVFRKSIKEDIPTINALFIKMVEEINRKMVNEGVEPYTNLENGFEEDYLDSFYENKDNIIFVAEHNNKVIGFLSVNNYKEDGYIYLDDYYIREEYRGKGIGSELMNMAISYAKEDHVDRIMTHVESANKSSIDFYKNRGFQTEEVQGHRLFIKKTL